MKQKLLSRAGESDIIKLSNLNITSLSMKLSEIFKHNFLLDIDLILHKKQFYIIDINPRIGGGYPFSHKIGFNMLKYLLKQMQPKKIKYKKRTFSSKEIILHKLFYIS